MERGRESDAPSASTFPKWQQEQGLDQTKARGQELYLGQPHEWQGPGDLAFSIAFPGKLAGSCIRSWVVRIQTSSHLRCWHCRQQPNSLHHNARPKLSEIINRVIMMFSILGFLIYRNRYMANVCMYKQILVGSNIQTCVYVYMCILFTCLL